MIFVDEFDLSMVGDVDDDDFVGCSGEFFFRIIVVSDDFVGVECVLFGFFFFVLCM